MLITVFVANIFKSKSQTTLLLSGIIVGGFMSAGISFVKFMADTDKQLGEIVYWLLGTFSKATMKDVWVLLPIVAICSLALFLIRWRINIVALGRNEATTLGLNYTFYPIPTVTPAPTTSPSSAPHLISSMRSAKVAK